MPNVEMGGTKTKFVVWKGIKPMGKSEWEKCEWTWYIDGKRGQELFHAKKNHVLNINLCV